MCQQPYRKPRLGSWPTVQSRSGLRQRLDRCAIADTAERLRDLADQSRIGEIESTQQRGAGAVACDPAKQRGRQVPTAMRRALVSKDGVEHGHAARRIGIRQGDDRAGAHAGRFDAEGKASQLFMISRRLPCITGLVIRSGRAMEEANIRHRIDLPYPKLMTMSAPQSNRTNGPRRLPGPFRSSPWSGVRFAPFGTHAYIRLLLLSLSFSPR